MLETTYILCALTCLVCTLLLLRAYRRSRARLLMWSAACFAALTLNNVLLFTDMVLLPEMDLRILRNLATLGGMAIMLYGLMCDAE